MARDRYLAGTAEAVMAMAAGMKSASEIPIRPRRTSSIVPLAAAPVANVTKLQIAKLPTTIRRRHQRSAAHPASSDPMP